MYPLRYPIFPNGRESPWTSPHLPHPPGGASSSSLSHQFKGKVFSSQGSPKASILPSFQGTDKHANPPGDSCLADIRAHLWAT